MRSTLMLAVALSAVTFLFPPAMVRAEDEVRLKEAFPAGYSYHVSSRVELSGTLNLPPEKGQTAAKALATLRGREYAVPEDVRDLALDVLRHRVVLSYEALAENVSSDDVLQRILAAVRLPDVPIQERRDRSERASRAGGNA